MVSVPVKTNSNSVVEFHTHTLLGSIDRGQTKKKSALIRPDSESVNEVIDQDPCARPEATGQLIDH